MLPAIGGKDLHRFGAHRVSSGGVASLLPFGSFRVMPLNIQGTYLRWHFSDTKSATIWTRKVHMDTFGEWIRQQRGLRRLTREELARRVGCSVSTLRKIEDGERRPSAQIAELLANCLNIPPAERSAFVRVARGELNVERLFPVSKLVGDSNDSLVSTASAPRVNLPLLPT